MPTLFSILLKLGWKLGLKQGWTVLRSLQSSLKSTRSRNRQDLSAGLDQLELRLSLGKDI